jgi:hypothetical protein
MARKTFSFFFDARPGAEPKRFAGIAYSGGVVPNYGWYGDIAIDLATLRNPQGRVPVLIDHDRAINKIAGQGELAVDDNALVITGELTDVTETGRMVAGLLTGGFPLQMSIGIQAETEELKAPQQINGRELAVRHGFRHAARSPPRTRGSIRRHRAGLRRRRGAAPAARHAHRPRHVRWLADLRGRSAGGDQRAARALGAAGAAIPADPQRARPRACVVSRWVSGAGRRR